MAYPHKWSPISYKSSAGQRKDTGQRPMLYRWTTQPTATVTRDDNRRPPHPIHALSAVQRFVLHLEDSNSLMCTFVVTSNKEDM